MAIARRQDGGAGRDAAQFQSLQDPADGKSRAPGDSRRIARCTWFASVRMCGANASSKAFPGISCPSLRASVRPSSSATRSTRCFVARSRRAVAASTPVERAHRAPCRDRPAVSLADRALRADLAGDGLDAGRRHQVRLGDDSLDHGRRAGDPGGVSHRACLDLAKARVMWGSRLRDLKRAARRGKYTPRAEDSCTMP